MITGGDMDLSRHNGADKNLYLQIGTLEAQVLAHEKKLDEMDKKLDQLLESSNKIKGGWVMLSGLMSAAILLGEFSHEIITILKRIFS
jgi:hypothetical protein